MWQRNNGRAEEELQIKFTGYLIQAVRRTQRDYLKALYAYSNQETLTDTIFAVSQTLEQEVMERLPLWEKIESSALLYALKQLDERERYVFLARVLDKRPFDVIGVQLGLSYKGAAAVYYRGHQTEKGQTRLLLSWCIPSLPGHPTGHAGAQYLPPDDTEHRSGTHPHQRFAAARVELQHGPHPYPGGHGSGRQSPEKSQCERRARQPLPQRPPLV